MSETKKIELTNHEVQTIFNYCYTMLLHGDKARIRNKVMTYFTPLTAAYQADRIKILEEYCKKDADQNPIIINGTYEFPPENEQKVKQEMEFLMKSEVPFTLDKDRKSLLKGAYSILKEDMKTPMNVEEGRVYDEIMSKLENI